VWTAGGGLVKWDVKNNTYTKFVPENGLPTTNITSFAIAPDDSLWIAGEKLSRFDGSKWTTYEGMGGTDLAIAPNGDVWTASGEYISRFDGQNWTSYSTKTDLVAGRVISLVVAPDGLVLVCTFEDGSSWISVFDGNTWETYSSGYAYSMAFSPDGTIWLGTWQGIEKFDVNTGRSQIIREFTGVGNLAVTSDDKLWFSVCSGFFRSDVPNGVWMYDGKTWKVYAFKDDLISCGVSAIETAPDGDIWFGARQGLLRFDGDAWSVYSTNDTLPENKISELFIGKDGVLWAIPESYGMAVTASRLMNNEWTTYQIDTNPAPDVTRIGPFVTDANGAVWYGSLNGAKFFDGNAWSTVGLEGEEIRDIALATDGKVWFTTYNSVSSLGGSWETFRCGEKLPCTFIGDLLISPDGSVWADIRDDGILHFDGKQWTSYKQFSEQHLYFFQFAINGDVWAILQESRQLVRFDGKEWTSFALPTDLKSRKMQAMKIAPDGNIWTINYPEYGEGFFLARFDGQVWDSHQYPGLFYDGLISEVEITSDGVVWMATEGNGIIQFDGENWTSITTENGLVSNSVTSIVMAPDGTIWFGTNYGISQFSPP
jgi:ligand-binding sensor domain-containing protein